MVTQELLLVKILKLVLTFIPEIRLPKRRGRPYVYSPAVLLCCFLVMIVKHESVRGLYAFLTNREDLQALMIRDIIPFPDHSIPTRRTFDRRLKSWSYSAQVYMLAITSVLTHKFRVGIARLSLDNRMFAAVGGIWHATDMKRNHIPDKARNIDISAGWGYSHYRGWVFGHALEVFVTTGKLVVPLLAIGHSLKEKGNTVVKRIAYLLPPVNQGVVAADSEYFDQKLDTALRATGRRLHAPSKRQPTLIPMSKTYDKRKKTVEPFFERFLLAFVVRGKLDRHGTAAHGYLVTCCVLYQLMVLYNLITKHHAPIEVTHLIRML